MGVEFKDISDWERLDQMNTGGTRSKYIAVCPNTKDKFYYKTSIDKYFFEFWSEIIAYQIGSMLKFNVCEYIIAYNGETVGCLSKSINSEGYSLIEGVNYIYAVDPTFLKDKNFKKKHSYQLIKKALDKEKISFSINKVIEMIIFDAIIGNSDRHSENWAIVVNSSEISRDHENNLNSQVEKIQKIKQHISEFSNKKDVTYVFRKILSWYFNYQIGILEKELDELLHNFKNSQNEFSQIYDSGSSLCRELYPSKIEILNKDNEHFKRYINKGFPDIKWDDQKLNHFDLVKKILEEDPETVKSILLRVQSNYDYQKIKNIIDEIDVNIPEELSYSKLPLERKEFILKYINSRITILLKLLV